MPISTNLNKSNPSNFILVLPMLPVQTAPSASKELQLNIFGTVIPSISFENMEGPWLGGKMQFQSGKISFEPWTFSFIVDTDLKNWKLLADWMLYINDNRTQLAMSPDEYSVDASLSIVDNFGKRIRIVSFKNVWIQQLGELMLSSREGENNLESSCTLYYDRIEII